MRSDGGRDAGRVDAGPLPIDFTEASGDNDPFGGGMASDTGIVLGDGARIDGAIDPASANEAWADSDGFAFEVGEETLVRAELTWSRDASMRSIAIHRADRGIVAWWGMSATGRALTHPVSLPAGTYFVHVAAAPGTSASAYRVTLSAGDLGTCAQTLPSYTESGGDNYGRSVEWAASFPTIGTATFREVTGIELEAPRVMAIEGTSDAVASTEDSYLDRDAFEIVAGDGTRELRVLLESDSTDVNLDVFAFDGDALAGTGIELSVMPGAPERAAIPVEPGRTYMIWIGARDERAIGGDTELPLPYRATLCAYGDAP